MRFFDLRRFLNPERDHVVGVDRRGGATGHVQLGDLLERTPIVVSGRTTTIPAELAKIVAAQAVSNEPRTYAFLAAAGQRVFAGADRNGRVLDVGSGVTSVAVNGSTLLPTDFAANPSADQVTLIDTYPALSVVDVNTWDVPTVAALAARRYVFVTTSASQTVIQGNDSSNQPLAVGSSLSLLYVNGAKMPPDEYIANSTTNTITLSDPFPVGSSVMLITW